MEITEEEIKEKLHKSIGLYKRAKNIYNHITENIIRDITQVSDKLKYIEEELNETINEQDQKKINKWLIQKKSRKNSVNIEEKLKLELYLYTQCKKIYKSMEIRFLGHPSSLEPFLESLKEMEESINKLQEKINARS